MDREAEVPLSGGRMTAGVVRIGSTVRRPRTHNSAFVQHLLSVLQQQGFSGAPKALGTDARGRDVLEYIEGYVPPELDFHTDQALREAAALIGKYHHASAGLAATVGAEVICHNDLSPCNFVFKDRLPVAIIDFDAAAPGKRAFDLGYAAWLWLDLGNPDVAAMEQARRLALFVSAYGELDQSVVLQAVLERQALLAEGARNLNNSAMVNWATACREWTLHNLSW